MDQFMTQFTALLLFCFSMTFTPGPNNIILAATGANHGYKAALPHIIGGALSIPVLGVLIGLGLGQLIIVFPAAHTALNLLGSAYLLYLAWKVANLSAPNGQQEVAKPLSFVQAVAFQWVNPKVWMMLIGAISTFTTAGDSVHLQVLVIAVTFACTAAPSFSFWAITGVGVGKFLQSPKQRRMFNLSLAALLVISLVMAQMPDA